MIEKPYNYIEHQRRFTSNSRGTKAGNRVLLNTHECIKYLKKPILTIGSGDGLETEWLAKLGNLTLNDTNIIGLEPTPDRVATSKKHGIPVMEDIAEELPSALKKHYGYVKKFNIYCAHTLEHTYHQSLVISHIKEIALNIVVIIVPIELRGVSGNYAHLSSISNLGEIINNFGVDWRVVKAEYRWNTELEGLIVLERNPVQWPEQYKGLRDLNLK